MGKSLNKNTNFSRMQEETNQKFRNLLTAFLVKREQVVEMTISE